MGLVWELHALTYGLLTIPIGHPFWNNNSLPRNTRSISLAHTLFGVIVFVHLLFHYNHHFMISGNCCSKMGIQAVLRLNYK